MQASRSLFPSLSLPRLPSPVFQSTVIYEFITRRLRRKKRHNSETVNLVSRKNSFRPISHFGCCTRNKLRCGCVEHLCRVFEAIRRLWETCGRRSRARTSKRDVESFKFLCCQRSTPMMQRENVKIDRKPTFLPAVDEDEIELVSFSSFIFIVSWFIEQ